MGAVHESNERYPPPLCHPGTREVVVGRVKGWHLEMNGTKKEIMWVHAPAGFGKTAVAGTVTEKLKAMKRELGFTPVGATFYFWRTSPERNSPARLIITLAYQLAQSTPELRPHVDAILKSEPDVVKMALEIQLAKLIVEPFKSLPNLDTMPHRLVIIDGIDECINSDRESRLEKKYAEDQETVQIRVLNLILRLQSHHLPLSFLILSRPEAWIKRHFESRPFRDLVESLDLYEIGDHMNDVKQFVRAELSRIAASFGLEEADEEWPGEEELVYKSEGHIIYASTVIRHIDDPYGDPRELLEGIIHNSEQDISHSTPFSSLYELYRQIMRSCPERNRALMMEVLEDSMVFYQYYSVDDALSWVSEGDVRCAKALGVLDRLSGRLAGSGLRALRPLHAVLRTGSGDVDVEDLFVHSSFGEFLADPHLSLEFTTNLLKGEERMLSNVLDCIASITLDPVGRKLDDHTQFALKNWWKIWANSLQMSPRSTAAHLQLIEKIIAIDLTACVVHTYLSLNYSSGEESPLFPLFTYPELSDFFVESMQSDGPAVSLSIVQKVTSHAKSALDSTFTLLLQSTTLPAFSPDAIERMSWDCANYLRKVTTEANWRENKLIEALRAPGPKGIDLFKAVIQGEISQDLRRHIYEFMEHEGNPILEAEDHPFQEFLEPDSIRSGSNPGFDWEGLAALIRGGGDREQ
ncbi:hypothetical protein H1R20_g709, partial [Candolleomyces eurysporus]